jgi:hypothetical protein
MSRQTLLKCCGLVFVILMISSAALAQKKSTGWIKGTWEGTGYQIDDKSTWAMVLTARGNRFSIDYPSLNCGGRWTRVSINASRARFREILTHGQDKCADRGRVLLQRISRKQLLFLYSYGDTRDVSASAVLNRKPQ